MVEEAERKKIEKQISEEDKKNKFEADWREYILNREKLEKETEQTILS